ncbi:uncharacterized protein K02A2.6-like [Lineus longissimus]|uniref:uncharacterized protein K02A2.6-like n=1 Tax=Lineus longissimus TaxID=88925 RepID=UPI00315D429C
MNRSVESQVKLPRPRINNIQDLMAAYSERFDSIGCMQGEVKLEVDPNIAPHIDRPRKVPIALKDKIMKLQGYNMNIEYRPGKELVLADTLSRLPCQANYEMEELDVRVDLVQFSTEKVAQIRDATSQDATLQKLSQVIAAGWPENAKELDPSIRVFWSMRDELSLESGIVLKGTCAVIPASLQSEILEKLHYAHMGIEKTRLLARNTVYCYNVNKDIERVVKGCATCQQHMPAQQPEALKPHEIPNRAWDVVGTDLFQAKGSDWLIVTDYYSKYLVVRKLPKPCPSITAIACIKQIFAEFGVPSRVVDDNGPHYDSHVYRNFAKEWGFEIHTSSPRYPKSNGFIESQVDIAKRLITKAV